MLNPLELAKGEVVPSGEAEEAAESKKGGKRGRVAIFAGIGVVVLAGAAFVLTSHPPAPAKQPQAVQAQPAPAVSGPVSKGSFSPVPAVSYGAAPDPFVPRAAPASPSPAG